MKNNITIRSFDTVLASEQDWEKLNKLSNELSLELWKDEPLQTVEDTINVYKSTPDYHEIKYWVAENIHGDFVANGEASVCEVEDDRHTLEFAIYVLKDYRRNGIGTELIKQISEYSLRKKRTLLMTYALSSSDSAEPFLKTIGGEMINAEHMYQVNIDKIDLEMLSMWIERFDERASDFEIGFWKAPYPEEQVAFFISMYDDFLLDSAEEIGQTNTDNIRSTGWTQEQLNELECSMQRGKYERWMFYARNKKSKELAGFTEIILDSSNKKLVHQSDTGVFRRFRNLGIGRRLKAEMIFKLLKDEPDRKTIRTGGSLSNPPMKKINKKIGFSYLKSEFIWFVELGEIIDYLQSVDNHT